LWQLITIFGKITGFLVLASGSIKNCIGRNNWLTITSNKKTKHSHYLKQLSSLSNRKKKGTTRLTRNSKIIKTIIAAIQEKKGNNIISLDLKKIKEAVADFFIICEAGSQPQIRAISENVEDSVKENCGENPYHHEGFQKLHWVLIDYVNVVVHVMQPEARKFYKLEEMWNDAIVGDHKE
jgi:ribosome-associated protein